MISCSALALQFRVLREIVTTIFHRSEAMSPQNKSVRAIVAAPTAAAGYSYRLCFLSSSFLYISSIIAVISQHLDFGELTIMPFLGYFFFHSNYHMRVAFVRDNRRSVSDRQMGTMIQLTGQSARCDK